MRIPIDSRIALRPGVHARRFGSEVVILDLGKGSYFGLDEIGSAFWDAFVSGQSPEEAARALARTYDASEAALLEDACRLIERLIEAGLVTAAAPPQAPV